MLKKAYEKIDDGIKKHWEAVSIASPDPITDIKPDMPPRIGWDNDMAAIIGSSDNNPCNVRQVEWELKAHLIGDKYPSKPKDNYVYKNQVDTHYKGWWKAKEGLAQKYLESNVHSFRFYMGGALVEGNKKKRNFGHVYINPFDKQPLKDASAKSLIMDQIDKQLKKLESLCNDSNSNGGNTGNGDGNNTSGGGDSGSGGDDTGGGTSFDPNNFNVKDQCGITVDSNMPGIDAAIKEVIKGSDLDEICKAIQEIVDRMSSISGGATGGGGAPGGGAGVP